MDESWKKSEKDYLQKSGKKIKILLEEFFDEKINLGKISKRNSVGIIEDILEQSQKDLLEESRINPESLARIPKGIPEGISEEISVGILE